MAYSKDSELYKKVEDVINQVRPYLIADGGNIDLVEITDEKVVLVKLKGACGSCPMSQVTLKNGVEQAVKKAVPEIVSVEGI